MLRLLWKFVLEVLPPACATVVAGILLSAYRDHTLPFQNLIDPRLPLEHVAPPVEGERPASVTPSVPVDRAAGATETDGQSSGPSANSATQANEGNPAEGKPPEAATESRAAQLDAVLMASSPLADPPAEMKAAAPPEAKAPDSPQAESRPTVQADPPEAAKAPDGAATPSKPAIAKLPDGKAVTSVPRPPLSPRLAKPAHKPAAPKAEGLPVPAVTMVPLPPPAAPPMVAMEPPPSNSLNRQSLPQQALPTPSPPPQVLSPSAPAITPSAGVASASPPAGALPGAPPAAVNSGQEGAAKIEEPKRVFGVPIPAPIVAVGGALDPRPVLSAGQRVFEKIVMTAKSVVPDLGHEQ